MSQPPVPKVIEVEQGVVGRWLPEQLATEFAVETTLPQQTKEERAKILAIIEGDAIRGQDVIGSVLYLSDYVIHPIELENPETGEVLQAVRTLLIQPDSNPIAFVSVGILKSIARLAWKEQRNPPFNPPLMVRLVQKGTGKGRRTYKLIPAE